MASLYKRATPSQARVLRIVEGAVRNACDAHKGEIEISPHFRRSIAKRAAGTLTAQWPDVLAARCVSSDSAGTPNREPVYRAPRSHPAKLPRRGGVSKHWKGRPLVRLWKSLAAQVRPLKDAGELQRAAAYVDVLKMISALQREIA